MINIFFNWMLTIGLVAGGLLLVVCVIVLVICLNKSNKKRNIEENRKQNSEFLNYFGGNENIISCESKGSRLILILKDYSLLNEEKLKENGISSMIKATNKVTLIVGEKSKELEKFIEENKRP